MRLETVPLTPANVHSCLSLWPDRHAYVGDEFARVVETLGTLLLNRRALGVMVLEDDRACAFGISTFVERQVVDALLERRESWIGKRLLLLAAAPDYSPILDRSEIAQLNAGDGLQLVVLGTNYDVAVSDPAAVLGRLMQSFFVTHAGYRIARIVNEFIGETALKVLASGPFRMCGSIGELKPGTGIPSALAVLTREDAASSGDSLLPVFAYSPPRVCFTRCEQDLLRAALDGAPDECVAARLRVALSSVKARWTRIQQRTAKAIPEQFSDVRPNYSSGRGAQTRHIILEYVRLHPSELTPYDLSR